MNLLMKRRRYNLPSLSYRLFFLLALTAFAVFWFPQLAEAVCANTTTFDPNAKTTLFNMGGVDLGRAVNIPPWVSPAQFDGATWWGQDVCTPVSTASTVTILPTSYTFQSDNTFKQSYLTRGRYDFCTDSGFNSGNCYPPVPICKPGNECDSFYSAAHGLDEAICNGHDCRWNSSNPFIHTWADLNPWPYNVYIPEQTTNGYGLKITGWAPLSVIANQATSTAALIAAEDSIINGIANHGTIDLKVDTPSLGDSYTYHIPATNCVKLSGNGPRKIVFMRGKSWNSSVGDFLNQANRVIDEGFKLIDPFKTYLDQFSFYIDLKKYDDSLPLMGDAYNSSVNSIKNQSSCNGIDGIASNTGYYYFYFNKDKVEDAAWVPWNENVAFLNLSPYGVANYSNTPRVAVHEMGHALARLVDEYINIKNQYYPIGNLHRWRIFNGGNTKNCTTFPYRDYHNSGDNKVYGKIDIEGCKYLTYYHSQYWPKGSTPPYYYRPSQDSMMFEGGTHDQWKFNVISCGYIVSAIKGESVDTKKYAQKHWPAFDQSAPGNKGCDAMGTVRDGRPPVSPTPNNIVLVTRSASPGFSVSLSGSGFTSTNNAAQFTNIATGVFYETLEIPSNGTALSFSVPIDAPPGNYTMKVGAFNSDWSNSVPFTIAQPVTPVVLLSASSLQPHALDPLFITWLAQGAASCQSGTTMANPPAVWTAPDVSGSFSLSFPLSSVGTTATFTLRCTGPGGTALNAVNIKPTAARPPDIVISATPQTLVAGAGTTVAWSTARASSCRGSGTGDSATLLMWNKSQPTTGSLYLTPTETTNFTLSCSGSGGTNPSTLSILVTVPVISSAPLSVSCSVAPQTTVRKNELTTYTAIATGGSGAYAYSWTGTDGLVGSAPQASMFYASSGTKTASVTVSSGEPGEQSQTAQCPGVSYHPELIFTTSGYNIISSISPTSGPAGTTVTVNGDPYTRFVDGASTVIIRNGGKILYVRPTIISPQRLSFIFYPSLPLPTPSSGMTYSVSVMNNSIYVPEGNTVTFTLADASPPPIPKPSVSSITPASGPVNTSVTLTGAVVDRRGPYNTMDLVDASNFSSGTVVIIKNAATTDVVTPVFTPFTFPNPAKLSFPFFPSFPTAGDYSVQASNQGLTSTPVTFSFTAHAVPVPVIYLAIVRIKTPKIKTPKQWPPPSTEQTLWSLPKKIGELIWQTLAAAVLSLNVNSTESPTSQTVTLTWKTIGSTECSGSTDKTSVPGWGADMALSGSLTVDPGANQSFLLSCKGLPTAPGGSPVVVSKTVSVPPLDGRELGVVGQNNGLPNVSPPPASLQYSVTIPVIELSPPPPPPATLTVWVPGQPIVPCGIDTTGMSATDKAKIPAGYDQSCDFNKLIQLANNIISAFIYLAVLVAVAMFAYAGWLYLTSAGDTGKMKQAHTIFTNAAIGFIFVLGAWLIVTLILKSLVTTGPLRNLLNSMFGTL